MNILNKVTIEYLRKNKVRTLMTIIGIILSVSMITAVTTFASSFYNFAYENAAYEHGYWHSSAYSEDYETYINIKQDHLIKEATLNKNLGYAYINSSNDYKPYLYVMEVDDLFQDMMSIHVTKGHYPTNNQEILLPEHLKDNGNVYYEIGDTITLELGERVVNGHKLNQFNPIDVTETEKEFINNEQIIVKQTKKYIVCGYYKRPSFENYSAPGYSAITLLDDTSYVSSYDIHYTMNNPSKVYDYTQENNFSGVYNSDLLLYLGVSYISSFEIVFTGLIIVIISLIMAGSISLIYNAFSISVSERIKQYGLLSSLGATHRQIRKMVYYEAFILGLIGIPLGILAGIVGIGITLHYIGNSFISLGSFEIPMSLSVSSLSIIIACIVSMITICLSAYIPSYKAIKITAVEAIRQSKEIKESKGFKTGKLTSRLFGISGVLANKYYKRSKKKYRSTIFSLVMSIVLFISASSLTSYLTKSVGNTFNESLYDLSYVIYNSFDKVDYQLLNEQLSKIEYIDQITYSYDLYYNVDLDERFISEDALVYYGSHNDDTTIKVSFIADHTFFDLLKKYNIKEKDYYQNEPMALVFDESTRFNEEEQKYMNVNYFNSDYIYADIWKAPVIEGYSLVEEKVKDNQSIYVYQDLSSSKIIEYDKYKIGERNELKGYNIINEQEYYMSNYSLVTFYYPISYMDKILSDNQGVLTYYMTSSTPSLAYNEAEKIVKLNAIADDDLINESQEEEDDRNIVLIINVLSYGFIVLISLISAVNVFNTITTNINLRKRDFAMLKSIGMSNKAFNKMLYYECLMYGCHSLMIGIPLSIIITIIIYMIIAEGFYTQFYIPIHSLIIAVLSVFIVVYISMIYTRNKVNKEHDVEVLKNENI